MPKKTCKTNLFFVGVLKVPDEKSRIRSRIRIVSPRYRTVDPYQNVTDPEHCVKQRKKRKNSVENIVTFILFHMAYKWMGRGREGTLQSDNIILVTKKVHTELKREVIGTIILLTNKTASITYMMKLHSASSI